MIYLDSSVVLAHLLGADRAPPKGLWQETLTASRLLEYEIWNRLHACGFGRSHGDAARALIHRVSLIELSPPILERALEPFPLSVRTLDGLHLASIEFMRARRQAVELATYDSRMAAAANALGIPIAAL